MEWQKVLEILTYKLNEIFISKKKPDRESELLSYLWNDQNIKKLVRLWLEDRYEKRKCKSIAKAQTFKTMGNKEFQAKNYIKSIEFYTKCALHAPANSYELSLAIANRSASLFYLSRYDDCIKDIELAIRLNYPKQLYYKLYLRAVQCYLKLGKQDLADEMLCKIQEIICNSDYITPSMKDDIERKVREITITQSCVQNVIQNTSNLLKLKSEITFEENVNFPYASVAIDRKYTKELGRHVVAKKFIEKGDILFLEKPVSFVLVNTDAYNLCQNCSCSNTDIPVPCTICSNTLYCNENCLNKAWSSYHCWECPGSQMELWKEIGIGHLALKVLLTCTTTTDRIKFNEMQNLVTNFDKLSIGALTEFGIAAIMLTIYLFQYTNYFETNDLKDCLMTKFDDQSFNLDFNILTDNNKQLYISSLLLRYILQLIGNAHAITKPNVVLCKDNSPVVEQCIVATGIYCSASMMNHSCDPNIIIIFVDQHMVVRASRDIFKDEEIFNCYGAHYRQMTMENRQKMLRSQYHFICKCKPCTSPILQYFMERFSAMKCQKCNGALCNIKNSIHCLDCGDKSQIYSLVEVEQGKQIFEAAQVLVDEGKTTEALDMLKKCLHIQNTVLYKYNEDITDTLNLMGKIYIAMGCWLDSIICLENTLLSVKRRFGSSSIELVDQLNDLTDVCLIYLEKELDTTTDTYKCTFQKTLEYLNELEEVASLNYGSWSTIYKDIKIKQEKINLISRIS
ncbi:protein-lysine N-methyltransferase SMYD4 [Xylocopa sonorina]|uniref:protein-lysine N-methyltransferase SMYD4 n=1 Tax=Xylocopa sonorina TaxID=1818115 RepID=UPI00403AABE2